MTVPLLVAGSTLRRSLINRLTRMHANMHASVVRTKTQPVADQPVLEPNFHTRSVPGLIEGEEGARQAVWLCGGRHPCGGRHTGTRNPH